MNHEDRVGLMVSTISKYPLLSQVARNHGLSLVMFTPEDVEWSRQIVEGHVLTSNGWSKKQVPLPVGVYNRCYPEPPASFVDNLEAVIGANRVFNHVTLFDKWEFYRFLKETSLGDWLPKTYLYDEESLRTLLKQHDELILKPRLGSFGRQLFRIKQLENGRLVLHYEYPIPLLIPNHSLAWSLLTTLAEPQEFLAQEFLDFTRIGNRAFDIRALTQKSPSGAWEVTAHLSRIAKPHFFITNIVEAIADPYTVLEEAGLDGETFLGLINQISVEVARELEAGFGHLGEISVDFGIDSKGRLWIIEANGKPDKTLFADLGDAALLESIYLRPLLYAKNLGSK